MTVEKMLYTATVQTPVAWNYVSIKRRLLHLLFVSLLAGQATPSTSMGPGASTITILANNCLSLHCPPLSGA